MIFHTLKPLWRPTYPQQPTSHHETTGVTVLDLSYFQGKGANLEMCKAGDSVQCADSKLILQRSFTFCLAQARNLEQHKVTGTYKQKWGVMEYHLFSTTYDATVFNQARSRRQSGDVQMSENACARGRRLGGLALN